METISNMSMLYSMETPGKLCQFAENNTSDLDSLLGQEDPRTEALRRYSYGVVLPAICCLGIVGNVLNLVVLTRKNMRGTAYIYMRAKYIGRCKLSDPKLNECLKEQTNKMIPVIFHGDENLGIPSLNPFKLPRLLLTPTKIFKFDLRNCYGIGTEKLRMLEFKMDLKNQTIEFIGDTKSPIWICNYTATGELLNKTFDDRGLINITFVNLIIEYSAEYELLKIANSTYYQAKHDTLSFDLDKIDYLLTHSDGCGNTQVKQLNKILNEEYHDFSKEFIPASRVMSAALITQIVNKVFSSIPADQLFDP